MIKALRKKHNLNVKQLAEQLNVTPRYINMLESGERTPGLRLAKRISDLFQVKVDDLIKSFFGDPTNKSFDEVS